MQQRTFAGREWSDPDGYINAVVHGGAGAGADENVQESVRGLLGNSSSCQSELTVPSKRTSSVDNTPIYQWPTLAGVKCVCEDTSSCPSPGSRRQYPNSKVNTGSRVAGCVAFLCSPYSLPLILTHAYSSTLESRLARPCDLHYGQRR